MTNLISSSSERWTASWAALTAWLFIPRVEQKRLCNLSVYKLPNLRNKKITNSDNNTKPIYTWGQHTRKSPAWMVPISIDCPISTSSCFTINSFALPISFFVAPLATEHISATIQHKTRKWNWMHAWLWIQMSRKSRIAQNTMYLSQF